MQLMKQVWKENCTATEDQCRQGMLMQLEQVTTAPSDQGQWKEYIHLQKN